MAWRKKGETAWKGQGAKAVTAAKVTKVEGGGVRLANGTPQQEAIWEELLTGKRHIVVKALAGTGKTFTVIEGLKRITEAGQWMHAAFIAFNKSIAAELQAKVPSWVQASTCHSLMFRALNDGIGRRLTVNDDRTLRFLEDVVGGEDEFRKLRRDDPTVIGHVKKLVGLVKNTLTGYDVDDGWEGCGTDELQALCEHYGVELNGSAERVFEYTQKIAELSLDVDNSNNEIDYDDMLWLPIVKDLVLPTFDLMCVDECQDLNKVQQEAILRMGARIMLVGDRNQAIYGFRGADIAAMDNLESALALTKRGVVSLPLTFTRRCPKSHVKLAQEIVPDFQALPEAPEGSVATVSDGKAISQMGPGDLVVCRTNAPVVGAAFRLIKQGTRANIQGRDIGQGLLALVKKLNRGQLEGPIRWVTDAIEYYELKEMGRLNKKKFPSEAALLALHDKCDCVRALCNEIQTVEEVVRRIETMFMDIQAGGGERNFVLLSSVHRAKGLEAETVWILEPEKMPHPMAKTAGEKQQEWNIAYVSLTRSKSRLVFVPGPPPKSINRQD